MYLSQLANTKLPYHHNPPVTPPPFFKAFFFSQPILSVKSEPISLHPPPPTSTSLPREKSGKDLALRTWGLEKSNIRAQSLRATKGYTNDHRGRCTPRHHSQSRCMIVKDCTRQDRLTLQSVSMHTHTLLSDTGFLRAKSAFITSESLTCHFCESDLRINTQGS